MYKTLLLTALFGASALANEMGNGMMNGNMMNGSPSSSSQGSVSTQQANAASCQNQASGMTTGLGDQLVTIVQVSDLNGTQLRYFPDNVVAPPGSIVQFQFHPKNHTVTESSFAQPCVPLAKNATTATHPGQKSGFVPVTAADTDMKVYNMLINDTKPIWIYCGQTGHCQKGMVMVINQSPTDQQKTLENFRAAAAQVPMAGGSATNTSSSVPAIAGTGLPSASGVASQTTGANPAPAAQESGGQASGTAAGFTGAAAPRSQPFQLAGLSAVAVAAVAAFL